MILLNGKEVVFEKFPNGETRVNTNSINKNSEFAMITLRYESDADLIHLMFLKKFLNPIYAGLMLEIIYMPYSRQDRVEKESAFTLKYICEFINSLDFQSVVVIEPHSDVTPALLNNCNVMIPDKHIYACLKEINFDKEKDFLLFPDAGAQKRYAKIYPDYKHLVGFKERDFATGRIKSLKVMGEVKGNKFKVLIIDDLCSKGGTFMLATKELYYMGAGEVYLAVTHCENSIADGDILRSTLINRVYTTNTILDLNEPKIHVTDVLKKDRTWI